MLGMTRRAVIMTLLLKTLFCRYTYKMVQLSMSACPCKHYFDRVFVGKIFTASGTVSVHVSV